jgi:tetratricopeptide (TPR) repeat protein
MEEFDDAIALLDRSTFIHVDTSGRITIHDLVRDMTLAQIDAAERDLLLDRTGDALAGSLSHANELMVWDDVRWEIVQSRAVIGTCRRHRRHRPLAALLSELGQYNRIHHQTVAALALLDEAARIASAFLPEDRRLLAKCKMEVSAAEPYSAAAITHAKQALDIAREVKDYSPAEMSEFYNAFGYALKMNGFPWRALPFYCRALKLCESEYGRRCTMAAKYLNNISAMYEDTGAYNKAIEYVTEANEIFVQLFGSEHRFAAISLNTLGRIQRKLGDSDKAVTSHITARKIFLKLSGPETKEYAMSIYFEGAALAEMGKLEKGLACANTALEILERKYGAEDYTARRVRLTIESSTFK